MTIDSVLISPQQLSTLMGVEPVVCDVLDPSSLKSLPRVDTVVHCIGFDRLNSQYKGGRAFPRQEEC